MGEVVSNERPERYAATERAATAARRDLQFRPLLHGSPLILPSPATQTFLTNTNYFSSLIEITFFRGRLIGKRESARESVAPSPPPPPFTAHLKDNPTIVYGDTRDTLVDVVRGREDSKTIQPSLHETGRENKSQIESARTLSALDRDLHFMVRTRMCHHRPRHRRVGVFPYALSGRNCGISPSSLNGSILPPGSIRASTDASPSPAPFLLPILLCSSRSIHLEIPGNC